MIREIDHFNVKQTAESGQCFRWKVIDENTVSIPAFGKILTIKSLGNEKFELDCTEEEFKSLWSDYLDLDTDYCKIGELVYKSKDNHLIEAFERGCGIRILRQDLWEVIISFLISQNNNIPRIKGSIEAVCRAADLPNMAFPKPRQIDVNVFDDRSLGLGYRNVYLREMYEFAGENPEWLKKLKILSYEDARAELLRRKGIGPKVADCICLFGLHHIEAFPIDTHVKQLLAKYYGNGFDHEFFKGYAGVIQQYLFYYEIN